MEGTHGEKNTGITDATHIFCGKPYTVFQSKHLDKQIITFQDKQTASHTQIANNSSTPQNICGTYRMIDRSVHMLLKQNITLTTPQVQEAIKHSKTNNITIVPHQGPSQFSQ